MEAGSELRREWHFRVQHPRHHHDSDHPSHHDPLGRPRSHAAGDPDLPEHVTVLRLREPRNVSLAVALVGLLYGSPAFSFMEPVRLWWEVLLGVPGGPALVVSIRCPGGKRVEVWQRGWRWGDQWEARWPNPFWEFGFDRQLAQRTIRLGPSHWNSGAVAAWIVGGTGLTDWFFGDDRLVRGDSVSFRAEFNRVCPIGEDALTVWGGVEPGAVLSASAVDGYGATGVYEWPPLVRNGVALNIAMTIALGGFGVVRRTYRRSAWAADWSSGRVARGQSTAWQERARRGK